MEDIGRPLALLSAADICHINADLIASFGGWQVTNPNLRDAAALDYILDSITASFFGIDLYPSAVDKAAALGWQLIRAHAFHDTNKRTGMEAMIELLALNGLTTNFTVDGIVNTALAVATGTMGYVDFHAWVSAGASSIPEG